MVSRKVDFTKDISELKDTFTIINKIRDDLNNLLIYYFNMDSKVGLNILGCIKFIDSFCLKYSNTSELSMMITNELLSADNVNYAHIHKEYPKGASCTNEELMKNVDAIFKIEDYFHSIVSQIWNNSLTNFDDYNNGDDMLFVVHSCIASNPVKLPGVDGFNEGEYSNTSSVSCSLITNQLMDLYNSKVCLVLDADKDSFICASDFDCATRESVRFDSVKTVKVVNDKAVVSGYTHSSQVVTRLGCPKDIIGKCLDKSVSVNDELLNYDKGRVINEVVLDKTKVKPKGILLISDGCDILFDEYLASMILEERYGCKTKVVNKGLYRKKYGLLPFTKQEYIIFEEHIKSLLDDNNPLYTNFSEKEITNLLKSYWDCVVLKAGYEEVILKKLSETFNMIREISKKKSL